LQTKGRDLATRSGARSKYEGTMQELPAAVYGGE